MRVDLVFGFRGKLCDVVKWSLLFCCVCFSEIPVAGESRSSLIVITGEVKDADGEPLPGVTVVLKGTSWGCATGMDGKFRLEFPGTTGDGITFSVCRNEESRSYGYRNPAYPSDDGERYEGIGRCDRDRVLHASEKCFYRGDYPDQG